MTSETTSIFSIRDTINFIVDEYARKKQAAGQLGLFEKPEERQKPLFSKRVDDESGRWVTMRGARVFISGEDGRIMKGPKALIGKTKEQIERESAGKEGADGEKAPKPKPLAEMGRISGGRADNRQKKLFEELNPGFQFEDDEDEDFGVVGPVNQAPSSPAEMSVAFTEDDDEQDSDQETETRNISLSSLMEDASDEFSDMKPANVAWWKNEIESKGIENVPPARIGLTADGKMTVINGRHRMKAAMELGHDEFPAVVDVGGESFELDSSPQPSPSPSTSKPEDFGKSDSTKQGALFDTGKGDLPGQELLFNSDAGDLNNPKTMENRAKQEQGESAPSSSVVNHEQNVPKWYPGWVNAIPANDLKAELKHRFADVQSNAKDEYHPMHEHSKSQLALAIEAAKRKGIDTSAYEEQSPAPSPAVNPFREKMDSLNRKADSLTPGNSAFDKSMASAFPVGVGRSGNASSRRTSKQAAKRIDSSINNALKSIEVRKQANSLQSQADAFDRGEIDQHGGRTQLGKQRDAEQLAKSQEKKQTVQNFWDSHADFMKATLKPGDSLALAANPSNTITVKRVNKTGITSEGGSKWVYADLIPLKDGKPMESKEVISAVNEWKKGQGAEKPAAEVKKERTPAESIQSHLNNDDHESAFDAFSKLKKDEVDKVAREVLGIGFYNKSKAQMLESLKRTLPLATKTASEAAQKKEEIDYAEMKLRKAKENQQAHSEDRLGAPIRSGVPEIAYTDPHGEGRAEVAKAWQAEVDDAQRELDRVKGLKNQDQGKTEEKPKPSNPIESKEIHLIAKNVGLKTQKQITKKGMGTLVSNIDNGVKTMKEAAKPIATRIFDGIKNHGANEITENLLRHTMISGNAEIAFDRAIEEFSKKSSYQGNPLDLNIRDERKLFADEMKKNKKEILAAFRRPPESPDKYSREQLLQTMNGVIDRYIRPESEVVQVDKYAHPLIHAAVGAGAMALAGKVFKSGPLRSVAHAAIGAAMAAWMQSAMAANGIQPAQAPSSPAANVATVSPPASQFQKQQMGNAAVNQIVQNAINQNAAKAQAAANAPPSSAQVSAHSISAAAAGKAGVPGVRPLTGANAAGIPGRVQVVNPANQNQSQTAGKEGATTGKLPVTEPAGGSGSFNADHPRHPAGASEGRGGEFAPKGEVESGSSAPESSSSPADNSGVFDVWHSPKSSSSQGYSGAASAGLGDVFATDSHEYASQYGTPEKHTAKMQNPYQMSAAEFRSFDRGPDASFEKSKARRQELESAGHDGILVSHADGTKEYILFNRDNLTKREASSRNYPDNLNKPASEQTDYSPPERSIEPVEPAEPAELSPPTPNKPVHTGERQSRKAAWEQHLQGMAQQVAEKKDAAKAEKKQAKELAKATSFNPAELQQEMADDVEPAGEAPKEEDFDSAKDYENALEKHNRSKGAKQATIKKRANADLIPEIAGQYDLDHSTLQQAVDEEIQMLLPYHNRKEEARQYISKMGWNARRINQAEDRGIDSSSTKFDDVASQWAGMFPEIAGSDESEWVARMWDLSKEGAQDPPSASDEELVSRVAKRLSESGASFSPAEEEGFEYADAGPVSGEVGDVDYTPFHRKAVVDLIVDRYMRLAGIV